MTATNEKTVRPASGTGLLPALRDPQKFEIVLDQLPPQGKRRRKKWMIIMACLGVGALVVKFA